MRRVACIKTFASRLPYASLLPAMVAVCLAMLPAASQRLQYDRLAIATGDLWRMFSGHWTHVSGEHLFWDVWMFVMLGMLCEQNSRVRYAVCVVGSALVISLTLWIALPDLAIYRGLSGIDSALFVLLAVMRVKQDLRHRHWGWVTGLAVVCLGFAAKVGYELATGNALFVDSQAAAMVPVPLAHGVGAVVGLAVGLVECPGRRGRHQIKDR